MNDVSTKSAPAAAYGSIGQVYRATLKRTDIPFNVYVCRPLAAVFVYFLQSTRVAPNQVTFFSLFVALGAALCFMLLEWPLGLWVGVGVYELSYVFDKVDGMLARSRGVQSASGHLLDFLMDEIKAFVILAAVAIGAHRTSGKVEMLLLGLGGVVCLASGIAMTTFQRRPEVLSAPRIAAGADGAAGAASTDAGMEADESRRAPAAPRRASPLARAVRAAEAVGRFFIHYPSYIWIAAVLTDARYFLYPYVAVNALYCARSLLGLMLRYGGPASARS
jgi:CDP-alcohol phosphatidyltransferase-like enzyme